MLLEVPVDPQGVAFERRKLTRFVQLEPLGPCEPLLARVDARQFLLSTGVARGCCRSRRVGRRPRDDQQHALALWTTDVEQLVEMLLVVGALTRPSAGGAGQRGVAFVIPVVELLGAPAGPVCRDRDRATVIEALQQLRGFRFFAIGLLELDRALVGSPSLNGLPDGLGSFT